MCDGRGDLWRPRINGNSNNEGGAVGSKYPDQSREARGNRALPRNCNPRHSLCRSHCPPCLDLPSKSRGDGKAQRCPVSQETDWPGVTDVFAWGKENRCTARQRSNGSWASCLLLTAYCLLPIRRGRRNGLPHLAWRRWWSPRHGQRCRDSNSPSRSASSRARTSKRSVPIRSWKSCATSLVCTSDEAARSDGRRPP